MVFNPRPRDGGDRPLAKGLGTSLLFQSAPPRMGATTTEGTLHPPECALVSIRAPRDGGDAPENRRLTIAGMFQSAPPVIGGDAARRFQAHAFAKFQSARPLVMGATSPPPPGRGGRGAVKLGFQSAPPCGGRHDAGLVAVNVFGPCFKIRAPAMGLRPTASRTASPTGYVSIRAPVMGATLNRMDAAGWVAFQSAPPVMGATPQRGGSGG